jgi:hypothetical protein
MRSEAQRSVVPNTRLAWLLASAAFISFLVLSIGYSLTRQPWWDEGLFADPAINFRNSGHLGSTVLATHGFMNFPGVHQFTFWQLPLYLISLGAWLRIVPVTIFWIRMFSVVWGAIYIYAWFAMTRRLSQNQTLGLLVSSVVALDYAVVMAASNGRMEMMCAALGQVAVAYFICNRESNWTRAIAVAACFGAASLFCHPLGAICNLSLAAVVALNWRDIRWRGLALAVLPYTIGLAVYACYVLQAPDIFLTQARAAYLFRIHEGRGLLVSIAQDFHTRYWNLYFQALSGVKRLKVASLLFGVLGTVLLAFDRKWRSQPLGRMLLVMAAIGYVGVAALDNMGHPVYSIYSMPILSACGAVWVYATWQRSLYFRYLPALLLSASILATVGGNCAKIAENNYRRLYDPAIGVIRANLPPGGVVMGGSELGFALGFQSKTLIDDRYAGYATGKAPDVFVRNEYYSTSEFLREYTREEYARKLLATQYHVVFDNTAFRVYARNKVPESKSRSVVSRSDCSGQLRQNQFSNLLRHPAPIFQRKR